MKTLDRFYIDGQWVPPAAAARSMPIVNPAT